MTDQTTAFEAALYDSLVRFNQTACWDALRLAQMRQYLAEHLAADPSVQAAARQATGQADTTPETGRPECAECHDTGACNGGPCAHPAAPAVGRPAVAPDTDGTEPYQDAARRAHRRLAAVERLAAGRPGYHQITVKALLTAMSETVEDENR